MNPQRTPQLLFEVSKAVILVPLSAEQIGTYLSTFVVIYLSDQ